MTDTANTLTKPAVKRMTYSVLEVAAMLGIAKNTAYMLCNSEQFKIIRIGRAIKVVKPSFDSWLNEGCQ